MRDEFGYSFGSAYELVAHVLERKFGFVIAPTARNDTLLRGDDAQLRRPYSTVLIRDDLSRMDQAVILAHELGHLALHGIHEREDGENRPARDGRAASRLDVYGPRERRELQANVFAREFLLPRPLARRLFLDEMLRSSEVAERLGLPVAMVRRQLLDALLRPEDAAVSEASSKARSDRLDASQQAAVNHPARAVLVEAGPGAGKTKTLIARIEKRLADGVPASRILVLTFSNKAAGELSMRLSQKVGDAANEVWVGTFHAFGLELLRLHYAKLGLPATVRPMMPAELVELLEDRLPVIGLQHFHDLQRPGEQLKELLRPIARAKDELVLPDAFSRHAERDLQEAQALLAAERSLLKKHREPLEKSVIAAEKTLEAAAVYEVYDALLRERRAIDLSDLVLLPTLLLERDASVRADMQARYSDILVDEYQDVNRSSARLLKCLWGPENRIWVVGDSRQAIYRFRGASSRNLRAFADDFEGAASTPLEWNYRSSAGIVSICREFAEAMDVRAAERDPEAVRRTAYEAQAHRGECGTATTLHVGLDDACESELVGRQIRALVQDGVPFGQQTILARTNSRLDSLAADLSAMGIPVAHFGSYFERETVRDVLSVLALVSEPNGGALVRIAAMPDVAIGSEVIAAVVKHAHKLDIPLVDALSEAQGIEGLSQSSAAALTKLGAMVAGFGSHSIAFDVVAIWLLERSDYLRRLAKAIGLDAELDRSAVLQLIQFLDQDDVDGAPLKARDALRRVRTVILMADDRDLRVPKLGEGADVVRLMTVHGAKGLEFPAVHIVGLHDKNFPLQPTSPRCRPPSGIDDDRDPRLAHAEEEDCIMFVALSRAEDHLRLYHTTKAKVLDRRPSPYLFDIGASPTEHLQTPTFSASRPPMQHVAITVDALTLHDLREFESCALKVLYRHRMAIRSRRHESPFLQTSGVIYELIDKAGEIAKAHGSSPMAVQAAFDELWIARGPVGNSLENQYRALAETDYRKFAGLVSGFAALPSKTIQLPIEGGHILTPAPIVRMGDRPTARFLRLKAYEKADLETGLLFAAGLHATSTAFTVEIASLADGLITPIDRSDSQTAADLARASEILATVRTGALNPNPQMRVCVRCAQFFACPATGHHQPH